MTINKACDLNFSLEFCPDRPSISRTSHTRFMSWFFFLSSACVCWCTYMLSRNAHRSFFLSFDYVRMLWLWSWKIEAANNWNIFMFACTFTHFCDVYLLAFVFTDRITLKFPIQLFVHYNYSEQIPAAATATAVDTLFSPSLLQPMLIFNTRHSMAWHGIEIDWVFPNLNTICSRDEMRSDEKLLMLMNRSYFT